MSTWIDSGGAPPRRVIALRPADLDGWLARQGAGELAWVRANGFRAEAGALLAVPEEGGGLAHHLFGLGDAPGLWTWAPLPGALPPGAYAVELAAGTLPAEELALAWGLASYAFRRYKREGRELARLAWPAHADRARVEALVEGTSLARDLVNTPAEDMGPEELAGALVALAERHDAEARVVVGEALLDEGWPAVHVVGRASARAPRLVDLRWGEEGAPRVTLVGKGVVFDSGGLDIKNADGMRLMKKDMGGAATVAGLAHAVMATRLGLRLRILVPAVENAISGNAFRPLDVIATRKGLSVEVGNTDAEGRLVLADALYEAASERPELVIDFATLTGAARVALGTELPALFSNDDRLAEELLAAGLATRDPLWRMPLHEEYRRSIDSEVADLSSTGNARTGGAITAALFLREFVTPRAPWAHVDTMAWNEGARPGRPAGGEAFGLRAAYELLRARYGGG